MQQKWGKWHPIDGLENKYSVDRIEYTIKGGFKIIFSPLNNEKRLTLTFKKGIYAHREADKKFMQQIMTELDNNYGREFYSEWTFFKVTDSLYLKWLSEESYSLTDSLLFTHFSILAGNVMIDIAHNGQPHFEWMV